MDTILMLCKSIIGAQLDYYIQVVGARNRIWKNRRKREQDLDAFKVTVFYTSPFQSSTQRRFVLGFQEYEL